MRRAFVCAGLLLGIVACVAGFVWAEGTSDKKIKIVATTTTLAGLTEVLLEERADIYAIASPKRDLHFYAPTPKDVLMVKKADVFVHGGLDLEIWREALLAAAGNPAFLRGGKRAIDASEGVSLLEIPSSFSRAEGDIHRFGNPHYWLDPLNGKIMARNMAEGLKTLYPEIKSDVDERLRAFHDRIDRELANWNERVSLFGGMKVVTYHRSLSYFAKRFGLEVIGELEPKPGIPPSPRHLDGLMKKMKESNVRAILQETYYETGTAKRVAKQTSAQVIPLVQAVGEAKDVYDYASIFEHNIRKLEEAFRQDPGRKP